MAEQISHEDWGNVEELGFSTIPEIDPNRPKSPEQEEDPESPEIVWSKKVTEGFVADQQESLEQLPH